MYLWQHFLWQRTCGNESEMSVRTLFGFIQNRRESDYFFFYIYCCMFRSSAEIQFFVSGDENALEIKHICRRNSAFLACFYKSLGSFLGLLFHWTVTRAVMYQVSYLACLLCQRIHTADKHQTFFIYKSCTILYYIILYYIILYYIILYYITNIILKVPYCQNWNFLAFFMITEV